MKVNRKISLVIAFVLIAAAAFSLSACKDSKAPAKDEKAPANSSAYDLYKAAYDKLNAAEGATMALDMNVKMADGKEDFNVGMKGTIAYNRLSADTVEMKMDEKMAISGASLDMLAYYKEGFMYVDIVGQKIKQPLSEAEALQQVNITGEALPENAIKDTKVRDVADGSEISFTVEGKTFEGLLKSQLGDTSIADAEITFKDAKVVLVVSKDGSMVSQAITLDFSATVEGENLDLKMVMDMRDIKPGKVEIDFPTDLDAYKEMEF